jgi:hypothetical protein
VGAHRFKLAALEERIVDIKAVWRRSPRRCAAGIPT